MSIERMRHRCSRVERRVRSGAAGLAGGILIAVVTVGPAAEARAEADALPAVVQVEDVLRLMYEHHPQLAARRVELEVAASDVVAAGLLPNPTVEYGGLVAVTGPNTIDGSQHTMTVEQPLLLAGQRKARRAAALARVDTAAAEIEAFAAELALEARQQFAALLAAQTRVERLEQARAQLGEVERVVTGRTDAGAMSRYDLARVVVERAALDSRVAEAETQREAAASDLARAVGVRGWRPRAQGRFAPSELSVDVDRIWTDAAAAIPALQAAQRAEDAAGREVEVARRERWPVPSLTAGPYMNTSPESWAAVLGFSLPLPLFDRGQAGVQRAIAEARAAGLQRLATATLARGALERAVAVLTQRRTALAAFEADVVGRLAGLFEMAQDAYRSGQGGILDLLDVVRTHGELQLEHVDRVAAVLEAEVAMLAAAGRIGDLAAGGAP